MPAPIVWKRECYIDFMGELQLESVLQLDLYTHGLNRILKFFLDIEKDLGKEYKPGVLIVERDLYFLTEEKIRKSFQDINYSSTYIKKIYEGLEKVKSANLSFEHKFSEGSIGCQELFDYIDILLDMMSFMVVQWLSFDIDKMSSITGINKERLGIFICPVVYEPYHIRHKRAYYHLLKNPTENNLKDYIFQYAFLENFEINKNEDEDLKKLSLKVLREQKLLPQLEFELKTYEKTKAINANKRQALAEKLLSDRNDEEFLSLYNNLALMRMAADEEEERHYQQARAVRNIRLYFEKENIDINIGLKDLRKKVLE